MIHRLLEETLLASLTRGSSVLLLGPRQTGKTTLMQRIPADKRVNLANLHDRLRYEKNPLALLSEIEYLATQSAASPLVIIDEIQKIPLLMDAVQDLIDRKIARFIVTGSSARKLKRHKDMNLLPGRVLPLRLDPLMHLELLQVPDALEERLLDGSLPQIVLEKTLSEREKLLEAYVSIYLEEEIRAEAIVRDLGYFARFLELAASEAGKIINFTKISQEIGVTHTTIKSYYQILEDCLVAERIEPLTTSSTRFRLSKAQKYLFYDLGVRRIAAREGRQLSREQMGHLFEHYVGLELIRLARIKQKRYILRYWRDLAGPEVDWVLDTGAAYIPVEVKWTDLPTAQDAKHLQVFLKEYSEAKQGFIICRTPHPMKISENIMALPWENLTEVFSE